MTQKNANRPPVDAPRSQGLPQTALLVALLGSLAILAWGATAVLPAEFFRQSWAGAATTVAAMAEYVGLAILLGGAALTFWRARKPPGYDANGLFAGVAAIALGALCLALDAAETGVLSLLGHAYKALGYLLVYRALQAGVRLVSATQDGGEATRGGAAFGSDALITTDASGNIEYLSPAAAELTGWDSKEVLGVPLSKVLNLIDQTSREAVVSPVERCMKDGVCDSHGADYAVLVRRDGQEFAVRHAVAPVRDRVGHVTGAIVLLHGAVERKQFEAQLEHVAHRDPMTGLPNRILINDHLKLALAKARRGKLHVAVMLLDLDRFKAVNDTLGHDRGDILLKAVAGRMASCLRGSDTLGRMGGDEFLVVLPDLVKMQDALPIARKLLEAVAETYVPERQEFFITCSIGISIFPDDGDNEQTLVEQANAAMYRAKEQGRNNCQFFGAAMNTLASERLALEGSLREALERGELRVYYQPRVNTRGQINGVEALLRWQHPDFGLLAPAQFLSLAEESGLIVPISEWVLHSACEQARAWHVAGHASLNLAVNLSMRQFREKELAATIVKVLQETGLDARRLELDLSESMLMQEVQSPAVVLRELKALGVQLVLDDFGTGVSSLSHLKRFPLDRIKIENAFVQGIPGNSGDARIVQAIIAMGHSLNLAVAAEGVETREQAEFLRERLCDEMQGSYFSEPLLPGAVAPLLQQGLERMRSAGD